MILRHLNAFNLCDAIIKNKEELDNMRILLLQDANSKKLKVRVIINEGQKDEVTLNSKIYGEMAKDELIKACEKVKETYNNKTDEENDNLHF